MITPPPPGVVASGPPGASPAPAATAPNLEGFPELGTSVQVDELPEVLTKVEPVPPADFSGEATVIVQALVDTEGRVRDARVVKSVPALDQAAVAAVRQWVFQPAKRQGQPVATWVACPLVIKQ
jgi:protein TonB